MVGGRKLRILVVDDDIDAADQLAEQLELEGHAVRTGYSGAAAVQAFRTEDFDAAFIDMMMPGKNGVEAFLEIRKIKPQARVFLMSGFTVDQLVRTTMQQGVRGVLSKPVDVDKALELVRAACPGGVVLVVGDDPGVGPRVQRLVTDQGYRCVLVRGGRAALDMLARNRADVLIIDLRMPAVDGFDVCSALQRAGRCVPAVIIAGSGAASGDERVRQLPNIAGVLKAPFNPTQLAEALRKAAA